MHCLVPPNEAAVCSFDLMAAEGVPTSQTVVYEMTVPNMPQSRDVLTVQMRKTFLGFILLPFCL